MVSFWKEVINSQEGRESIEQKEDDGFLDARLHRPVIAKQQQERHRNLCHIPIIALIGEERMR